jgi:DNA transformation protein
MPAQNPYVAYLLELLSPLGTASARRMFGGWGLYLDGTMVGLVADEVFYLKTDEATRGAFETAGSTPFAFDSRKRAKTIVTSYWSAPEQALDAPDAMRPWVLLALQAAQRKAAARPKRKRPS